MLLGTMHHCALHCVTKLHEVADHGHTVKQLRVMLQKLEPILSATVARNNFKDGHTAQRSSCAQCCTVCSGLNSISELGMIQLQKLGVKFGS